MVIYGISSRVNEWHNESWDILDQAPMQPSFCGPYSLTEEESMNWENIRRRAETVMADKCRLRRAQPLNRDTANK